MAHANVYTELQLIANQGAQGFKGSRKPGVPIAPFGELGVPKITKLKILWILEFILPKKRCYGLLINHVGENMLIII